MADNWKSPWRDNALPQEYSLPDFLFSRMQMFSNETAVVTYKKSYSYAEAIRTVKKLTYGLQNVVGLKRGDVLGTYLGNEVEFMWLWMAALRLGATVTTCNPNYTHEELVHQFTDSGVTAICIEASTKDKFLKARADLPKVQKVITLEKYLYGSNPFVEFDTLLSHSHSDASNLPWINPDKDIAFILYSSGTTGLPKGVLLTHQAIINNHFCLSNLHDGPPGCVLGPGTVALATFQYFHAGGFILPIWSMMTGATRVSITEFNVPALLKAIEKWKVSVLVLVPPVLVALAKSPLIATANTSSLKTVLCGAAPLGKPVALEVSEKMGIQEFVQIYGMTELGFVSHMAPLYRGSFEHVGSIGRPCPNVEAKIVNIETGEGCPIGQSGEMWIRVPSVMAGYLNNSQATKNTITTDGWLKTGDIAYVDELGYCYIVDRLKELIKVRGFQVAPAELESLILQHQAVADVIVVGVPDDYSGELPRAYVVLKDNHKCTEEELQQHVKNHVAYYKQLKGGVRFMKELPKTGSGKMLRRELRDRARAEAARHGSKL